MGFNSPIPVRLQEETRKAAKILRSFVDSSNNGLDKVIPHSVLERAQGFAIFTVVRAGMVFTARAGSGVCVGRLDDGGWSPPSAIGLGGLGFGGSMGAEVTDFIVVLNSKAALVSFMSAGQLNLGLSGSIAAGPLGRNAEATGSLNSKGHVAAMYSYSKTKGLFGGVSLEGSVLVERQDANRLAYGGNPTSKQILSGTFDPPDWAQVLTTELERCTMSRTARWRPYEQEGEWGEGAGVRDSDSGNRSRSGSAGSYAFGEGVGAGGVTPGRRRAGSLFGKDAPAEGRSSPRPSSKRQSSFNPFNSGSTTPKKSLVHSSESYNAGLTPDSSGAMAYGNRSRSGSNARNEPDLLGDWDNPRTTSTTRLRPSEKDLLGIWDTDENGLTAKFNSLSTGSPRGTPPNGRSRASTITKPFDDIHEDPYLPHETESQLAKMTPAERAQALSPGRNGLKRDYSPFGEGTERRPFDDYHTPIPPPAPKPNLSLKSGLNDNDGYARAVALFPFSATAAGDLGLKKGDIVVVLDKVGNGDWWRGRTTAGGGEGIFPTSYVEVLTLPKDLRGGVSKSQLKARMASLPFE